MAVKRTAAAAAPVRWRIGEVAKLTGVTTRTLRYWEELGLLQPASRTDGGERLYGAGDVGRVTRIRDWQELLGFSLAEVRAVLSTGDVDVLDRVQFELRDGEAGARGAGDCLTRPSRPDDQLVGRLDEETLCAYRRAPGRAAGDRAPAAGEPRAARRRRADLRSSFSVSSAGGGLQVLAVSQDRVWSATSRHP